MNPAFQLPSFAKGRDCVQGSLVWSGDEVSCLEFGISLPCSLYGHLYLIIVRESWIVDWTCVEMTIRLGKVASK